MKAEIIMGIFFIAALLGCQIGQDREVPEELSGVWETSSPRYEDCSFEFDDKWVIFENGLKHYTINLITNVEKSTKHKTTLYHIYYRDDQGEECRFSLYYLEILDRPLIRFQHQGEISWLKREGQSE